MGLGAIFAPIPFPHQMGGIRRTEKSKLPLFSLCAHLIQWFALKRRYSYGQSHFCCRLFLGS